MHVSFDDLETLVEAPGAPGNEYAVADRFAELIEPHVDSVSFDAMGNVVATSEGSDFEIMLAAHTDELGFLVEDVDDDGFLTFHMLGGHYKGNLSGQRVRVGPDGVLGVVGPRCRHYMSDDEKESLPESLRIDVGATSPEEVADMNVEPGDYAVWDYGVSRLGNDRITGRALDDRIALAILLAIAREEDVDATVHYVATVQEEVGLRGARTAGYSLDPDVGIALEIFPVDDYPAGRKEGVNATLDGGPVVEFGDGTSEYFFGGVIVDRQTRTWLRDAANATDVDLQHDVMLTGSTDATELQQVRGGRNAGAIAVPCRYSHSPVETLSIRDADATAEVLLAALEREFPSRDDIRRPR
ncbi:peptidase M42 [Haladaptatus sp. W1]|uniref:M42 family metallopeptidase n=1 Tax=Haladaptatus sp. W1 TaxID=1897478 RepID=UPI000849DADC|nr:M20/M25/M40 family metallo-hydrolase [Haladaptatus sp. W1]ODR82683.1 peptidase M42 [Haladaptatus sp. W1]